jgi:hypothetical protein
VPRKYHHFPGRIDLLAVPVMALGAGYCQGSKSWIQIMQGLGIASKIHNFSRQESGAEAPLMKDLSF